MVVEGESTSHTRGPDAEQRIVVSSQPPATQIMALQQNVRLGSCGAGQEEGLAAMLAGLRKMAPGECNVGFLRDEANLLVVIFSDEDDQSDERDIDAVITELARLKPLSRVRLALLVGAILNAGGATATDCRPGGAECGGFCERHGPVQGSQVTCRSSVPPCDNNEVCGDQGRCVRPEYRFWSSCHWCAHYNAPDCCSAIRGTRYLEFAHRLEAAVVRASPGLTATGCRRGSLGSPQVACIIDSICQESFDDTLRLIATALVVDQQRCRPR